MKQSERLMLFAQQVRGSSLKRLRKVRPEDRDWRPAPGRLSFVDHLKHLVDCDRWIMAVIQDRPEPHADIKSGEGEVSYWQGYMQELEDLGRAKDAFISGLTDIQLDRIVDKPTSVAGVDVGNLILRHNLDHEIHHRGAINLLLLLKYPDLKQVQRPIDK